jgi:hypothetical protein
MRNRRRDAQRGPPEMEPAGRHGTSSPRAVPSSGRARRSLGRLVVTPTFATGACILFAAVLAYGTTRTHLAFRGLGPACAQASCSAVGRGQAGGPRPHVAGAPGRTYANGYSRTPAAPDPDANAKTGRLTGRISSVAASPGLPVVIAYRTVRRWHGGFAGTMTITNRSRSAIPSWLLFVRYRRARMDWVRGARWYPASSHGPGAGVVAPRRDQLVLQPGASAEFTFRARGHFGPPAGCFFDTARCRFHPTRRLKPLSARGSQWSHRRARNERGQPGNGAGSTRGVPGPGRSCAGRNDRCENTGPARQRSARGVSGRPARSAPGPRGQRPPRGGQRPARGGQRSAHGAQWSARGGQRRA